MNDAEQPAEEITVAALTAGTNIPSSRFRMRQYISRLAEHGVNVREHLPFSVKTRYFPGPFKAMVKFGGLFRSRDSDLVWISRGFVEGYETFERLLKRPRVLDVDDAVWLRGPFGGISMPDIARAMDAVVAGNSYLAEYFGRYCKNVHIIPTAIDLDRYTLRPEPTNEEGEKFVIGWTGSSSNFKYLDSIEPALARFIEGHDGAELVLTADRPWEYKLLADEKVKFVRWSVEDEIRVLHSMSVGIMPLADDKWTRGKCAFKMLQYMGVGLPVIVSPVGMNRDVLDKGEIGLAASTEEEWYDALVSLYKDKSLGLKLGLAGRKVVEQFYNADIIASELADIFKSLAGR
ncbi:MAG: glycosyltransferase family 4 protein [Phycisphaerae bacterium]|nr:glycosyltransferase family 4 protein [Phycisphaerae bacterium]